MKGDPIYTDSTLRHRFDYQEAARIGDWIILQWRDEPNYEAYLRSDVVAREKIKRNGTVVFTSERTTIGETTPAVCEWCWVADWWIQQHRSMADIKGTDVTEILERLSVYRNTPTEEEHFII